MFTLRQLLVVSGQYSAENLNSKALFDEFDVRPLSIRSVMAAYEKQRFVIFVSVFSSRLLVLPNVRTLEDLQTASRTVQGIPNSSEVLELSSMLREQGLSIRFLDRGMQKAAIIGLAPDLVLVPTVPINNDSLTKIRDFYSGAEAVGGAVIAVGAVGVGAGLAATAPAWILPVSAFVLGAGLGWTITAGVMDMMQKTPPPKSSSNDFNSTPNDLGQEGPPDETIDIPNAVSLGSPPDEFNVDNVLEQLGDFSVDFTVDMVLSDLPIGFDPSTGRSTPGLPSGEGNDDGGDGPNIGWG